MRLFAERQQVCGVNGAADSASDAEYKRVIRVFLVIGACSDCDWLKPGITKSWRILLPRKIQPGVQYVLPSRWTGHCSRTACLCFDLVIGNVSAHRSGQGHHERWRASAEAGWNSAYLQ